jgi:CRP-like cAMP-binding protein
MSAFLFQHLTSIAPLKDATIDAIRQCLRTESHDRHHLLVREGELSSKMYFITNGAVRAFFFHGDKEYTDWFVFENMFFCTISAFYGGVPSVQFIETLEPTELLVLQRSDISRLSDTYVDFQKLHNLILTQSLLILQQNIIDQRFKVAQERYRQLVLNYPQALQRVPLKHIASYLGVTQETLSRIRSTVII